MIILYEFILYVISIDIVQYDWIVFGFKLFFKSEVGMFKFGFGVYFYLISCIYFYKKVSQNFNEKF